MRRAEPPLQRGDDAWDQRPSNGFRSQHLPSTAFDRGIGSSFSIMGAGASTSSDAQLFTGEAADKGISFEQLQAAVAQQPSSTREQWTADRLKTAFEQHDADGDGFLSKAEYEAAVASTGGGAKDFGRDLPGAAEAAGMRQESEEAIDTAMMAAASRRTWSGQQQDETTVAVALSLAHEVKSAFLGAEVKKASNVDTMFIDAWGHLGQGEVDAALQLADKLCSGDKTNEKFFYTRAVCHARKASWRFALADYSTYLKLVQTTSGPALANALYGRALCLAKLGKRALALRDLDECIRVGPPDEQVTEPDASLVPMAVIARFCLLQALPGAPEAGECDEQADGEAKAGDVARRGGQAGGGREAAAGHECDQLRRRGDVGGGGNGSRDGDREGAHRLSHAAPHRRHQGEGRRRLLSLHAVGRGRGQEGCARRPRRRHVNRRRTRAAAGAAGARDAVGPHAAHPPLQLRRRLPADLLQRRLLPARGLRSDEAADGP